MSACKLEHAQMCKEWMHGEKEERRSVWVWVCMFCESCKGKMAVVRLGRERERDA